MVWLLIIRARSPGIVRIVVPDVGKLVIIHMLADALNVQRTFIRDL